MPMSPAGFITDVSGPLSQGVHAGLGIAEMQQRTALIQQQQQARAAQTQVLAGLARDQLASTRQYQQVMPTANPSQPGYGAGGGGESDGPGAPGGAMGMPAPQQQPAPDPSDQDWERMINVAERAGSPEALSLLVKEGRSRENRAKVVMVTRNLKDNLRASGQSIADPRWQTMFRLLEAADDPEHMLQDIASKNAASLAQDPLNQARVQGANERAGIQAGASVDRANIGADASRYRTDVGAQTAEDRLTETNRHNTTGEGMAQDRLTETERHHGVQETQGQTRLDKPSTGTLVNWAPYRRADDASKHARTMMESLWKEISAANLTGEDVTSQKAEYEQAKADLSKASKARDDALVEWEKTGGKAQGAGKPAAPAAPAAATPQAAPAEDPQAKQKVVEMIDTLKEQGKSQDEIYRIIYQAQHPGPKGL